MKFSLLCLKLDDALARFRAKKAFRWILYPALLLFVYVLYFAFCFSPKSYYEVYASFGGILQGYCGFGSLAQLIIYYVLLLLSLVFGVLYLLSLRKAGRLDGHKVGVFFVFLLSALSLSFLFTLKANTQVGHVDWCLWNYYDDTNTGYRPGHWTVIMDIFHNGSVEEFPMVNGQYWYDNQYYQNKFWHYLIAYFMRFNALFVHVGDTATADAVIHGFIYSETEDVLMEMNRIAIAYIAILSAIMALKLLEKLRLRGSRLSIAMGLYAITPIVFILPSNLNNDSLELLFSQLALYFALAWHEKHSYKNIILVALMLGCGMATKLNAGVVAFPIAVLFLYELIGLYRKKEGGFAGDFPHHPYRNFWLEILVFAVIVFPLGLFFTFYNHFAYGMPLGYVWDNGPDSAIYINPSAYNPFLRYFLFPAPDLFFSIWSQPFRNNDVWGMQDFNIWTGFLKTSITNGANLGDYPDALNPAVWVGGYLLYIIMFVLAMFGFAFFIFYVIRTLRGRERGFKGFAFYAFLVLALSELVSYVYFNWEYPYSCTMHARYIILFYLPLYAMLAEAFHRCSAFIALLRYRQKQRRLSA